MEKKYGIIELDGCSRNRLKGVICLQKRIALFIACALVMSCLAGCLSNGNGPSDESNIEYAAYEGNQFPEEVTLRYVIPDVFGSYPGWNDILTQINVITKTKINALIEVELIPIDEYTDRMNMKFVSGEEFDLCFTGAWNPYSSAAAKNAYAELTKEMLNEYAPDIMEELNDAVWDAVTINGKIYGVPLQQIYVRQTGIRVAVELAEKYDFDLTEITSLDDLDTYAALIKKNEPDAVPIYVSRDNLYENMINYMGFDCLVSTDVPGAVYFAGDATVVNQFESDEFRTLCEKARQWNLSGYLPSDAVIGSDSANGKIYAIAFDPAHKPGGDATESQSRGYEIEGIAFGDCAMTTSAIQATITAISAKSQNPERALAFINLLNTDADLLNLFCHGIEGVDYEFVSKDDKLIAAKSDYPGMYSFLIGNVFNEYYTDPSQIGTWEETAQINKNAKASCVLGFAFDSEPVSTQIAQCAAVVSEYLPALSCGAVDVDSTLDAFLSALKEAGVDDIIAEMQSQVDMWSAKK